MEMSICKVGVDDVGCAGATAGAEAVDDEATAGAEAELDEDDLPGGSTSGAPVGSPDDGPIVGGRISMGRLTFENVGSDFR